MSTAYSPYGCDNLPPASHVLALYTGQPRLPLAVGYLLGNGHRLYDQRLMRFTRPDGLSPFGKGGLNAYAYCVNDPINKSDPTGQSFIPNIHLLKKLQGGYSYKRLSPRLDSAKPNLSQREYRSLDASLSKRQSKLTKQEGRFADAERSRLAQQQARLQSLVPSEVDGKTRYHAPAKPYAPASSLDLNSRQLTRYLLTHGLPAGSSAPPESRPVLLNGNTLEEVETNVRNAFARSPSSLTQIETDLDALLARLVVLRES
ncbi:RHS repeat-associated core domain-containing protein [Pseudomonas sp. WHRI 8519]|uniref:RHS repeat-associated core domain-containing protein n=1 Tax=Pseudomonas TaxID=286 RepID=UPI0032EE7072